MYAILYIFAQLPQAVSPAETKKNGNTLHYITTEVLHHF